MLLSEVKPIHCQDILNKMTPTYAESTVYQCRITRYVLFETAVENDILVLHPDRRCHRIAVKILPSTGTKQVAPKLQFLFGWSTRSKSGKEISKSSTGKKGERKKGFIS